MSKTIVCKKITFQNIAMQVGRVPGASLGITQEGYVMVTNDRAWIPLLNCQQLPYGARSIRFFLENMHMVKHA